MLLLALVVVAGQAVTPSPQPLTPDAPTGCPVKVLSAQYQPRQDPQPLLDPKKMNTTRVYGTLRIRYRNTSGKGIRSVTVEAHYAPRTGVAPPLYRQPDPNAQTYTLDGAESNTSHMSAERVTVDASSLLMLQPTRITFADGTTWTSLDTGPDSAPACAYTPPAAIKPAARQAVPAR